MNSGTQESFLLVDGVIPINPKELEEASKSSQANPNGVFKKLIENAYPEFMSLIRSAQDSEAKDKEKEESSGDILGSLFLDYMSGVFLHLLSLRNAPKNQGLSFKKLSCLLHIAYLLFSKSFSDRLSSKEAQSLLNDLLMTNSIEHLPRRFNFLGLEDIKPFSSFMFATFFRYYDAYFHLFVTERQLSLFTLSTLVQELPPDPRITKSEASLVQNLREVPQIQVYLPPKEYEPTEEEIQEIMKGNSVHNISQKEREKIIQRQKEKERKNKIDSIMSRELEKIHEKMNERIKSQDQDFLKKFDPKAKKG